MDSSLAWLTAATTTLDDAKKGNNDWDEKKKNAELMLDKLDRKKRHR